MPGTSARTPATRAIRDVANQLCLAYGRKTWRLRDTDPLDGLVATILSQHTSDHNSSMAFASLKARFPDWEQALAAPVSALASAIRSGGLARQKARRLKAILRQIKQEHGRLSLGFLRCSDPAEGAAYLQRFRGVGRKTAACVLLFYCRKPVFPVDTHVLRVTGRLGWLPAQCTADRAHGMLQATIPPALVYDLHLNLIAHGRRVCRPRQPLCGECALRRFCAYYAAGGVGKARSPSPASSV